MEMRFSNSSIGYIPYQDVIDFLELNGWVIASNKGNWIENTLADFPSPIVIPKHFAEPDLETYVKNAIEIIAASKDLPFEDAFQEVYSIDRDVLRIRNPETDEKKTLSLRIATRQVDEMKKLVAYSAASESDLQAYHSHYTELSNKMLDTYRFGHTIPQSFGFSIESPVDRTQVNTFLDSERDPEEISPVSRKVMLRIARGLKIAKKAEAESDVGILINGYINGFNSNMCDAVSEIGSGLKTLDYRVKWSPRLKPPKDVREFSTVSLGNQNYQELNQAAKELRDLTPEKANIEKGLIISLTSKDNPGKGGSEKVAVIRWIRDDTTFMNVRLSLSSSEYLKAIEAHKNWFRVSVSGYIERRGNFWYLTNATGFQVHETSLGDN